MESTEKTGVVHDIKSQRSVIFQVTIMEMHNRDLL